MTRHILTLLFIVTLSAVNAQVYPFADDENIAFAGIYPLKHNEDIVGYCTIGMEILPEQGKYNRGRGRVIKGKGPTRRSTMVIQLMDAELNVLGKSDLRVTEVTTVRSVAYNGELLALEFVEVEEEKKFVITFDGAGQKVKRYALPWLQTDKPAYNTRLRNEGYTNFHSAPGGFIYVANGAPGMRMVRMNGEAITNEYKVSFLPNDPDAKAWHFHSPRSNKRDNKIKPLVIDKELLVLNVTTLKSKFFLQGASKIIGLDIKTGKVLFEHARDSKEQPLKLSSGRVIGEEIYLVGYDVGKSKKLLTAPPHGIDLVVYSKEGKPLEVRRVLVSDVAGGVVKSRSGPNAASLIGAITGISGLDGRQLFLHDFHINAEGQIFVAGEMYTGGNGRIFSEEGIGIALDRNLKPLDFKQFEKGRKAFYGPNEYAPGSTTAYSVKLSGGFNFGYLYGGSSTSYGAYTQVLKKKKRANELNVHLLVLHDGQLSHDKISFPSTKLYARVLPAKEGYVLIGELNREKEKYGIRIERLDLAIK